MLLSDTRPKTAAELYPDRLAITINEFCQALGWDRSRYYRRRDQIKVLDGYGNPMIPVAELDRILSGEETADV